MRLGGKNGFFKIFKWQFQKIWFILIYSYCHSDLYGTFINYKRNSVDRVDKIADYSILERPVICFAYDYEDYKSTRGLYIDFEKEMPNGILDTEDKVINHIKTMDYKNECNKTRDMIKNKFTYLGGHATEMCVEKMFGK